MRWWAQTLLSMLFASLLAGPQLNHTALAATGDPSVAAAPVVDGKPAITVHLVTDAQEVTPGEVFRVGLWFNLEPGWHLYWQNPGDAGFPTEVLWEGGHATFGPLQWPAPTIFRESDGVTTYGYANEALLFTNATVSDSISIGEALELRASARYLACNIVCNPGEVQVSTRLPVAANTAPAEDALHALFTHSAALVPITYAQAHITVDTTYAQSAIRPGDNFRLALLLTRCSKDSTQKGCDVLAATAQPFVAYRNPHMSLKVLQIRPHPSVSGGLAIVLQGHVDEDVELADMPEAIGGVVQLNGEHGSLPPFSVHVPYKKAAAGTAVQATPAAVFTDLPPRPAASDVPVDTSWEAVLRALALALVGGLILNLMPCVLPVLAIKVIGIAQVGHLRRRDIVGHGISYSLGVIMSMLLLAAVVWGLRAVGTQVGWGFQFQEPWFVATVSCVLVVFALNCFGVFEVYTTGAGLGALANSSHGHRRSFLDGILAVVLATPCSAPFLGSAVAYALTQRTSINVLIFATIGVGLAAPYVLLTLTPGWTRFIPKPGAWMNYLKTALGFGLLGTAIWLVWLIGRFAGVDAVAKLLLFLLGVSFVSWLFGLVNHRLAASHQWGVLVALAALLAGIGAMSLSFKAEMPEATAFMTRPYSQSATLMALSARQPVFVDFGADWCITCKYNEQHVLTDPAVTEAFKRYHVVALRADWTRRDETIRRTLASFGRAGVPMYLLYDPDNPSGPDAAAGIAHAIDILLEALGHRMGYQPARRKLLKLWLIAVGSYMVCPMPTAYRRLLRAASSHGCVHAFWPLPSLASADDAAAPEGEAETQATTRGQPRGRRRLQRGHHRWRSTLSACAAPRLRRWHRRWPSAAELPPVWYEDLAVNAFFSMAYMHNFASSRICGPGPKP